MLRIFRSRSTQRPPRQTPTITNATLFTIDWAEKERKRNLSRFGTPRVWWWSLNHSLHQTLFPKASLEQVMYHFHRRHHAWTFWWLTYWLDVDRITQVIRQRGALAGLCFAIQLGQHQGRS